MRGDLPAAGEFARVVSGCPKGCTNDCLGDIVLVLSITGPDWACECPLCGEQFLGPLAYAAGDPPSECYVLNWLERLPPDRQLLEEIEREVVPA